MGKNQRIIHQEGEFNPFRLETKLGQSLCPSLLFIFISIRDQWFNSINKCIEVEWKFTVLMQFTFEIYDAL